MEQAVARNAVRELELYLPMGFLFARGEDIGAVLVLCGIIWCAVFVLFPLFNRDRLRLGDVIAGTWVLKAPKQMLLPDKSPRRRRRRRKPAAGGGEQVGVDQGGIESGKSGHAAAEPAEG